MKTVKIVLDLLLALLAVVLGYVLVYAVSALFVDPARKCDRDNRYYRFLIEHAAHIAVPLARIRLHLSGLENVPEERFLLVGNHRSKFDPILTWHALRGRQLAFISKPENFKVPFFGRIVRRCGFMPIDREDPRSAIVTVNEAAEKLKSGAFNIGVYPEGTRSKDCTLLPFHDGVFMIAKKAHVPVVVLAVRGTEEIRKHFPLRPTDVYLDVVDVIPKEEIACMRTSLIGGRVYDDLAKALSVEEDEANAVCTL